MYTVSYIYILYILYIHIAMNLSLLSSAFVIVSRQWSWNLAGRLGWQPAVTQKKTVACRWENSLHTHFGNANGIFVCGSSNKTCQHLRHFGYPVARWCDLFIPTAQALQRLLKDDPGSHVGKFVQNTTTDWLQIIFDGFQNLQKHTT